MSWTIGDWRIIDRVLTRTINSWRKRAKQYNNRRSGNRAMNQQQRPQITCGFHNHLRPARPIKTRQTKLGENRGIPHRQTNWIPPMSQYQQHAIMYKSIQLPLHKGPLPSEFLPKCGVAQLYLVYNSKLVANWQSSVHWQTLSWFNLWSGRPPSDTLPPSELHWVVCPAPCQISTEPFCQNQLTIPNNSTQGPRSCHC